MIRIYARFLYGERRGSYKLGNLRISMYIISLQDVINGYFDNLYKISTVTHYIVNNQFHSNF